MDTVNAIENRPERLAGLSRELLTETDDAELQAIVVSAARNLETPMALVSLVLDQIQFFKAHHGLPDDLRASRGLRREASFCQFVVRDGVQFEVRDARGDERLPQHIVDEYGIRSYLGIPIRVGENILGSLCVLDTQPREFSTRDVQSLTELAARVNKRLNELNQVRANARRQLSDQATGDALSELNETLTHMTRSVESAPPTLSALHSFMRLAEHVAGGGSAMPNAMKQALVAARSAVQAHEALLYDIEAAVMDCQDYVEAMEHLTTPSDATPLSDVIKAAQDLSRRNTREAGGAPMPDLLEDPLIHAPRPLAVALLTTCLSELAKVLLESDIKSGIQLELQRSESAADLLLHARGISDAKAATLVQELNTQLGRDPSVRLDPLSDGVRIRFIQP